MNRKEAYEQVMTHGKKVTHDLLIKHSMGDALKKTGFAFKNKDGQFEIRSGSRQDWYPNEESFLNGLYSVNGLVLNVEWEILEEKEEKPNKSMNWKQARKELLKGNAVIIDDKAIFIDIDDDIVLTHIEELDKHKGVFHDLICSVSDSRYELIGVDCGGGSIELCLSAHFLPKEGYELYKAPEKQKEEQPKKRLLTNDESNAILDKLTSYAIHLQESKFPDCNLGIHLGVVSSIKNENETKNTIQGLNHKDTLKEYIQSLLEENKELATEIIFEKTMNTMFNKQSKN